MGKTLFLLGSNDTFPLAIKDFAEACGGGGLLFLLPGCDYDEKLKEGYKSSLGKIGVSDFSSLPSDNLNADAGGSDASAVEKAKGLVLGGGRSNDYFRRYCREPYTGAIRKAFVSGVPVMACCGSAMIVGETYTLYQEEEGGPIECRPSLGLVPGHVFGIHFEKGNSVEHMIDNMARAGIAEGLGLGVKSWMVFVDGAITRMSGSIYKVRMTDLEKRAVALDEINGG